MSAITAVEFVLFAAAVSVPSARTRLNNNAFLLLGSIGFAGALLAAAGYLYGLPVLYRPIPEGSIAVHTALGFLVAFAGLFATRSDIGWFGIVNSSGLARTLGRQLLPVVIIVPLALGWLTLAAEDAGWLDPRTALAVFALANVAILAALVARTSNVVRKLEASLHRRERIYGAMVESALDAFILVDADGLVREWNPQAERLFGWRRDEVMGRVAREFTSPPEVHAEHSAGLARLRMGEGGNDLLGRRIEMTMQRRDGGTFQAEMVATPLHIDGDLFISSFVRDLTDIKKAEEQLRQAQKMEAVGQLTGGIAHDFNNTLTAVIAMLDTTLSRVSDEVRPRIQKALDAADRGAGMIRQLLAFSRKQVLSPEPLDLNATIQRMEVVLRQTLGAQIDIALRLEPNLPQTMADRGQVESAILNLSINARDAMPEGGQLTIETRLAELDDAYALRNPEASAGHYIMVAVSDTGVGMTPTVLEHAFEPFFSTKDVDRGSGLGLSMVHGFTKQSGGHAKIYSEVGFGTSVRLYLPLIDVGQAIAPSSGAASEVRGGDETILVVEDDALVRAAATTALRDLGYTVIEAADGAEARTVLQQDLQIDALFTDIVMPGGITGRMLAEEAVGARPQLRVLYTSGYTDNTIVHQGRLDPGVNFLSKPYHTRELARRIRDMLDAGALASKITVEGT